jgi:hypothetical protein
MMSEDHFTGWPCVTSQSQDRGIFFTEGLNLQSEQRM